MVDIRLLIASDVRLYSEGLHARLASTTGLCIRGVVSTGAAVLSALEGDTIDVALVDISMPDSLLAIRTVSERWPEVGTIGLCVPEVEDVVIPCIMAGLAGYLPREGSIEQLVELIRTVARGEAHAAPHIVAGIFRRLRELEHYTEALPASGLSPRELEIVGMLEDGRSNKEIARTLQIRLPTVKKHVHTIFAKLHIERRSQVAGVLRDHRREQWQRLRARTGASPRSGI